MTRFILLDIEGTTTDIDFVHRVLFPYSAERLADFVRAHQADADVQAAMQAVRETVRAEEQRDLDEADVVNTLLHWIQIDRKHGALKQLQGLIWREGFESGMYQGHVYPDVPIALAQWRDQGLGLGIYSSGSVQAQRLLFAHSVAGDLTPYFSHFFDTAVGGKREPDSYARIAAALTLRPLEILFLSDIEAELDAAAQCGYQVLQLVRKSPVVSKYPTVATFADIQLDATSAMC